MVMKKRLNLQSKSYKEHSEMTKHKGKQHLKGYCKSNGEYIDITTTNQN